MSIDRECFNGPITFCCDSCGETDSTYCSGFEGALAKVKSHGWKAVRNVSGWVHYCKDCK